MKGNRCILCFLLMMICSASWCQLLPSVVVQTPAINQATVDRAGDLYVVSDSGIVKYTMTGEIVAHNTMKNVSLFDPGNGVTMLCYIRNTNQLTILNPQLEVKNSYTIDKSIAISPVLACMLNDYHAIILDSADWSMKVIDIRDQSFVSEFALSDQKGSRYSFMKAYQNFIFLLNPNTGIEVYNRLGKKLRTINSPNLLSFNFLGEELYYYADGTIHFVDLYTLLTREQKMQPPACQFVLLTDKRLMKFFDSKIEFINLPK